MAVWPIYQTWSGGAFRSGGIAKSPVVAANREQAFQ
jgi:hypothetical protein